MMSVYANLPGRGEGFKVVVATNDAKGTFLSGYRHDLSCSVH